MTLGPGFQIGQLTKKSVLGVFVNHQWDVAGSGGNDCNMSYPHGQKSDYPKRHFNAS
jgi:hypothetical protein